MEHDIEMGAAFGASLTANNSVALSMRPPQSAYHFTCYRPDGSLRWEETAHNVVTQQGRNHLLQKYFLSTGDYTPAWYVGLKGSTNAATSSDIMSSSGRDWSESTAYSDASRIAIALGTVSSSQQSVSNSSTKSSFTINQTASVYGAFVTNSTQIASGSTYTLYGVADFDSPSSSGRGVVNGDTLQLTVTLTASTS